MGRRDYRGKTTFVTPVDNCKQSGEDAVNCVVSTLQHFTTLHPSIRKCILKNDNTGNYHCATFVVGCALLLNAIGITVLRVHYSAPGGKDDCDRIIATLKVRLYEMNPVKSLKHK